MKAMRFETIPKYTIPRALPFIALLVLLMVTLLRSFPSDAQTKSSADQWLTFGHDPQRSGWASEERAFARENATRLGLVWDAVLPNPPRALNGLTAPLVIRDVATAAGPKTLVIVAGSSDRVFALDADTGALVWTAHLSVSGKPRNPEHWLCPNALNATPVIDPARGRVFVIASDGQLHALSLRDGHPLQPPLRFVTPYSKMWSLNYVGGVLYTTLAQGCNGGISGIYALDPDAPGHSVAAFFTSSGGGAGAWGRGGPVIDFDGYIYAATGDGPFDPAGNGFADSVVRVAPKTLRLIDYYTPPNWQYITKLDLDMGTTTPVIFRWKDRVWVATGGKEGVIYVMDTESLGGPDHHVSAFVSPRYSNEEQTFEKYGIWGALSSWQDPSGRVWLYVPTWGPVATKAPAFPRSYGAVRQGSIMAFQVVADPSGKPVLQPAWLSRDLIAPQPVAIAGPVVFALEAGEDTAQAINGDIHKVIKDRKPYMQGHATLFALDAETGRELWNSGQAITDWTHFSGIAVGAGKVFVTTHQGGVYAFGLSPEGRASLTPQHTAQLARAAAKANAPTASALSSTPAPIPGAAPAGPIACAGAAELFQQKCAMCHGPEGKGSESTRTPDLTDPKWQASRTDAALLDAILNGKSGESPMPPFQGVLTPGQAQQLVQCVIRRFASAQK